MAKKRKFDIGATVNFTWGRSKNLSGRVERHLPGNKYQVRFYGPGLIISLKLSQRRLKLSYS